MYLVLNIFLGCSRADVAIVDFGGESQRVERLIDVLLLGRDVDKHQGLAVASQTVLKKVGQL